MTEGTLPVYVMLPMAEDETVTLMIGDWPIVLQTTEAYILSGALQTAASLVTAGRRAAWMTKQALDSIAKKGPRTEEDGA